MKKSLQFSLLFLLVMAVMAGCQKDEPLIKKVSPGRQISSFKIVTPSSTGVLDTINRVITVTVPGGTDVTGLETSITLAEGYTINPLPGTAQDFSDPVVYRVTGPENSTVNWTVIVSYSYYLISENISENTTLISSRNYVIQGDVEVGNNAILTIEPGTVIKFESGASLSIGFSSGAKLIADGTEENPVVFTSNADSPAAGAWEGLFFYSNTLSNTILDYCRILYAGSNESYGALNVLDCDIAVTNTKIERSGSYGIFTTYDNNRGGFVSFEDNSISDTEDNPIVINAQKLSSIGSDNIISSGEVSITGNFSGTTPQTWKKLTVPYVIEDDIEINGDLTIEPGTIIKCGSGVEIHVGYFSNTTFKADGTSADTPVTFTSSAASPSAGAWEGIRFWGYTLSNTIMNFCRIDYAGADAAEGAIYLNAASIAFTNNTLTNSSGKGMVLTDDSGFETFSNNTINNCADHIISINTMHLPELGVPNNFTPATGKGILVQGNAIYTSPVVWKKQTADFYIDGGENDIDGELTIEAGTTFRFISDSFFWFGYFENTKVTAAGTSNNNIIFTTASASPVEGSWPGLVFDSYVMSSSSLEYCSFRYSGMNDTPALYTNTSFNVSNNTITDFDSTYPAMFSSGTTAPTGLGNNFTWQEDL